MRRAMLAAAAAAVLGLALSVPVAAQDRGGVLKFARYDGSTLVDPIYAERNPDIWMVGSLYSTLLEAAPDGSGVTAGLAAEFTVSDDGTSIALTLRDGVRFSDGSPMSAADVVFSLERARNPDLSPWAGLLGAIEAVSGEGNAVAIHLSRPDPTILSMLATFNTAIVSRAAFENAAGATDQEKSASLFAAGGPGAGTGPFYLSGFEQGTSMSFKANPYYWKTGVDGEPLPYIEGIEFEVIPDDATRILKLQAGEVDVAEFVPFARIAELDAAPNLRMELFPSTRIIYAPINTRAKRADGSDNPLADKRVRQALNFATNREALISLVLHGVGSPMTSPLMSSSTPMATRVDPLYGYDPVKAAELMQDAGFQSGLRVKLTTLAGSADDATIFAALQQMWAAIGIDLVAEQVDSPTRGAKNRSGEFDIHTYGWVDDIADPSQVVGWLGYTPTANAVGTGWLNEDFNALYEAAGAELDPESRAEQFRRMQEIYADEAPLLFLYETPFAVALSSNVSGYVQTPLGANVFEEVTLER